MTKLRRNLMALALCSATLFALSDPTPAQDAFPSRTVRFVVGFPPGGGVDAVARLFAEKLSVIFGQPVVVMNHPGAAGGIAGKQVSADPPDGYTVLVGATGQMSIATAIYPKLGYHAVKSFIPLNMIASFPLVMVVPAQSSIKSVKDLIAYGKANPDRSNYGTSSPSFTIACELFKLKTGMPAVAIPYKSSNESNLSLVGGQTLFTISDGPPAIPLVQGGKTRAIAKKERRSWDYEQAAMIERCLIECRPIIIRPLAQFNLRKL